VGKIKVYDKIVIENQKKKRKCGYQRHFYMHFRLKHGIGIEGRLMPEGALTSFRYLM